MPIYEYRCQNCGYQNDYLQKLSDPPITDCPQCAQASMVKLVSAAGFQLKGSGWYATDFKGGKSTSGGESAKPEGKAEAKTETKSEGSAPSGGGGCGGSCSCG
jgi:putative FmdB family regulatory protein